LRLIRTCSMLSKIQSFKGRVLHSLVNQSIIRTGLMRKNRNWMCNRSLVALWLLHLVDAMLFFWWHYSQYTMVLYI
jgi:hypothetical protein